MREASKPTSVPLTATQTQALAYARDIVEGKAEAEWHAEWYVEMAQALLQFAERPDFWRPSGECPEC